MIYSYSISLLPYFKIREEEEAKRAARARKEKTRKVKKIPHRFCSVNNMYPINPKSKSKFLSAEGRIYKDYIVDCMREQDLMTASPPMWDMYECTYVYYMTHEMMWTKDREFRKTDVTNFLKASEDAIFDHLLQDDSLVVSVHGYKRVAPTPSLEVHISEGSLDAPIRHLREGVCESLL